VPSIAPLVATDVLAQNEAALGQMTYRELLDVVRRAATTRRGS
jgi:hypothetical protein